MQACARSGAARHCRRLLQCHRAWRVAGERLAFLAQGACCLWGHGIARLNQHPCGPPLSQQDMVVRREKVAVLTQGTLTDAEMLAAQPEASYLLALAELSVPGKHSPCTQSAA